MKFKKTAVCTLLSISIFASSFVTTTEAASDKEVGYLTNFTVKYSGWTYAKNSAPKKKRDSTQTGGNSIVNLNLENGDAWVDVRIVYADTTTALASGSVQRGQKQAFDYNRHVVAGPKFHIGVKKTYNTGNQGPSNDRTATITNGRWSPDNY